MKPFAKSTFFQDSKAYSLTKLVQKYLVGGFEPLYGTTVKYTYVYRVIINVKIADALSLCA